MWQDNLVEGLEPGVAVDQGCLFTDDIDQADMVMYMTCSVRQHAEDKVISKIGQLKHRFRKDPNLILAIAFTEAIAIYALVVALIIKFV